MKDYVRIKGWELHDIYVDEGISGKNITERPEINRLITEVLQKKIDNVLVFKIDRLTRSTKDLITLMDTFNENDCAFNSIMESIDTSTASGRMFIKIIGIFAEFERENLIERVSVALEKKVREGYTLSTFIVPYGYSREKGKREITINEEEAKVIREIFSMYLNKNYTYHKIAENLNMRKVESRGESGWHYRTIEYMINNPIYAGIVRYGMGDKNRYFEAEGKHEAIISREQFAEVQSKVSKFQKKQFKKRPREDNYYCGTLMCAVCGSKFTTHNQYQTKNDGIEVCYCNYVCIQKVMKKCNAGSISHNKVEAAFRYYIDNFDEFEVNPEDIDIPDDTENTEDITIIKADLEVSLSKLSKKETDIMTLYINDKLIYEEYTKMLELIRYEKKAYADKIAELEGMEHLKVTNKKEDVIENFRKNWDLLNKVERMQLLQEYIKAIYITSEPDENYPKQKKAKIKKLEIYKN